MRMAKEENIEKVEKIKKSGTESKKGRLTFTEIDVEQDVVKIIIDLTLQFGQEKKGSFFIITSRNLKPYYRWLYTNILEETKVNIKNKRTLPLIQKLAELDGAVIIDDKGYLVAYGAEIKVTKPFRGHGTRHSAALGISTIPGTLAIVSSEEDGAVRIFRNGILLVEINPYTKTPPTLSEKIAKMVTSSSIPLIGGGSIAALALGVNPLLAAFIFTGSYIITRSGTQSLAEFLKSGKLFSKAEEKGKKE